MVGYPAYGNKRYTEKNTSCPLFDFGKWFLKITTQSWLLQEDR
jgi:hypothetical protein